MSALLATTTWGLTRESIVNVDRMRRLMARWPKGRLETVEGAKHELMMERAEIRTRFFDRAAAFFRENG